MTAKDSKRTLLESKLNLKHPLIILLLMFYSSLVFSDSDELGHTSGCKFSDFSPRAKSEYILPFQIGEEYTVSQGNCGGVTHVKDYGSEKIDIRYAYDFDLPIGEKIIASRSGIVINKEDFYSNKTTKIEEINFIFIQHNDGTVALYLHLSPKGSLVEIGDKVSQGDVIGIAGNSGFTGGSPHLHFDVRRGHTRL